MSAVAGLAGAVIGGVLVLLVDIVRRRAEDRRTKVSRLAEVSIGYATVAGRLFARARDAFEKGDRPSSERPERYEASVRFFMTPGMEEVYPAAMALMNAYATYAAMDPAVDDMDAAVEAFFDAQRHFESGVRQIAQRGTISASTAITVIRGVR